MLTKAKLAEYIEKGNRFPVGTRLITIELGECEIVKATAFGYRCEGKKTALNYNEEFKLFDWHSHSSLIDPAPINNPFTKEMLELIKGDEKYMIQRYLSDENEIKPRRQIINTIDTYLTAPNEWPQMMEVSDGGTIWHEKKVVGMYNGFYLTEDEIDCEWHGYPLARPIQPKEKTLADLVKGDKVWAIDVCLMDDNKTEALCFGDEYIVHSVVGTVVYFDTKHKKEHGFQKNELHEFFQLTPPTEQQLASAEAAEIQAVKNKYEAMKKEVKGE